MIRMLLLVMLTQSTNTPALKLQELSYGYHVQGEVNQIASEGGLLVYEVEAPGGVMRVLIGDKPFFESVVPKPTDLFLPFFENYSARASLDWGKLGVAPDRRELYRPRKGEFANGQKAACDLFEEKEKKSLMACVTVDHARPVYIMYRPVEKPSREKIFEVLDSVLKKMPEEGREK